MNKVTNWEGKGRKEKSNFSPMVFFYLGAREDTRRVGTDDSSFLELSGVVFLLFFLFFLYSSKQI